ncbi:MAG: xanthine dehydrogenase family protein molybdopterin-binding subunit [Acidimicrobiia bacterium]|nr:xanthine dehydrogenase family protein molybdopterin-binding subunit [bacterium]MXZ06780.1 xanthine dehydrogenase family protein molybdopterin-binding subunit [Acidimicrobiia bacterium]MYF26946.1 xanthine dehydrogenase family protein molybdopterin-binding subunit [Acidimicrobiia bacterium]
MTVTTTDPQPSYKWVGTRPVRHDGLEKVTGRAKYGADLNLPGMLVGAVLRSPHAHARILSIDTSAAESMDGVKAVVTGADFPMLESKEAGGGEGEIDPRDLCRNVMARDKVLYEGHALAAVAATSRREALAALDAIRVDYEVLPHVLDVCEAMATDAPILHDDLITEGVDPVPDKPSNVASRYVIDRGDVEKGFAEAAVIVEREFVTRPVHQGYIESHAVVADVGEDGKATIFCSSQGHFMVRASTARLLGWETSRIKVIPAEIGGGFGGKTLVYIEPVAARLSQKAGRPVKIVMTRDEVFRATGPTSGSKIRLKVGADRNGKLTAVEGSMAYQAGAFKGSPVSLGCMCAFAPYSVENVFLEGLDVVVNMPKVAAYRAPGAPMASFASETLLDEIAAQLGIDPLDLRLRNAAEEGVRSVYGPVYKRIGYKETVEAIRDHPHYSTELGPNQGRGVASGFWFNFGGPSSATVHINEDGSASVLTGSPDIGGSRASMALMAAEELGIDVHDITPIVSDTESVGFTDVTGGSRVTHATGMAVIEACRKVVADLRSRAAKIWGVDADEVEWVDGRAQHVAGDRAPMNTADLAALAGRTGGPITASAAVNARGAGVAFSTQVCDVEVDPETGAVKILRYTTSQDAGRAIHPSYVEGQMQGGVVQGIGWALNEEYIYDRNGVMENPGFLDYRMPVASDLPMIDTVIVEVPNPGHPYGVRGVGEVGIVPPMAAVANAIHDAIGLRLSELPMSPVKVLAAIGSNGG